MADNHSTPPEPQDEKVGIQHENGTERRGSLRDNMDETVRKASIAAMTQNLTGE
jgi:hypothetical protein